MLVSVILAGGSSTRIGFPKALLPYGHTTFLNHIIHILKGGGIDNIWVVLGDHAPEITAYGIDKTVRVVVNPQPKRGQLSSLKIAIQNLDASVEGILVAMVDHPRISSMLIRDMGDAWKGEGILIPTHRGENGHPVVFPKALFPQLLHAPEEEGARFVVRQNREKVRFFPTEEEGVVKGINTPQEYQAIGGDG